MANLIVNWRLDKEAGGLAATTALASPALYGVNSQTFVGTARYAPTLSQYYRPFSRDFCPSGTRFSLYKCDFRPAAQSAASSSFAVTVPSDLSSIFAKIWGAGGGGYYFDATYNSAGGGGGFSEGAVSFIDTGTTPISGQAVQFVVGGYGTGSNTVLFGAGGGGASGIRSTVPVAVVLSAGGGGGASFSNFDATAMDRCFLLVGNATTQCGLGGGGGSAFATVTAHAPSSTTACGGRGGDTAAFTGDPDGTTAVCDDGGANPTTTTGGTGGGTALSGGSTVGQGGAGYDGTAGSAVGAGGGGGGASNTAGTAGGGEAGGFDAATDFTGYGGGGGAGFAVGTGVTRLYGEIGAAPAAGASTNFYYSPAYLSAMTNRQNPGRGGTATSGATVNGRTGAITILW